MPNRQDVSLDCKSVIAAAQKETGLEHFGDPKLPARVERIIDAYRSSGLAASEEVVLAETIVDLLATRLEMEADRIRFPEIAEEKIECPLVVVGFPRSGTTLTYELLAQDPASRSPRWWDALHPTPPVGLDRNFDSFRKRLAHREAADYLRVAPIQAAHKYFVNGGEMSLESYMLWGLDFRTVAPFLYFRVAGHPTFEPGAFSLNLSDDMVETYQFQHNLLQALQWRREKKHWVIKDPTHQYTMPEMQQVFPDATFVWPHRDPIAVFASMVELSCIMVASARRGESDRREMARGLLDGIVAGMERILNHPIIDSENVIHVSYNDLIKDPIGVCRNIYEKSDRAFTQEFSDAIGKYRTNPDNKADLYGKFHYDLKSTGMSEGEVREALRPYIEKFGV